MRNYDQIVVGGGIGGLTLAALLGLAGRRVLLLEKGPRPGGSMARFVRRGVPFDTGFHFTGGFVEGGVLADMLEVLGIAEAIRPDEIRSPQDNRFLFESSGREFALPVRYPQLVAALRERFPGEKDAIDRYFAAVDRVCADSLTLGLRAIFQPAGLRPEDTVSLAAFLDGLTRCEELKTILAAYVTCYGVPVGEASFANHSRICHGLYRSCARVVRGGEAFTDALLRVLAERGVEVRCSDSIRECADIRDRRVGRFVLASGEEVGATDCIFTIHPRAILAALPRAHLHKAFVDRVEAMQPSIGFFALYGVVRERTPGEAFSPAIISLFPAPDMTRLFDKSPQGDRTAVILKHQETAGARRHNVLTALEASEPADVARWQDTLTGRRPEDYQAYKRERCERLVHRILRVFPDYAGRLEVLETASMLTFRDYLHTPCGEAYGVRQTLGQANLFGRLPFRNLYAAGQSAMLPGLVGSMLSSFVVARSLLGREAFATFLEPRMRDDRRMEHST